MARGRVGGHHREQASLATQRLGVDTIDRTYLDTHHRFSPLAKMDGAELTLRGGGGERNAVAWVSWWTSGWSATRQPPPASPPTCGGRQQRSNRTHLSEGSRVMSEVRPRDDHAGRGEPRQRVVADVAASVGEAARSDGRRRLLRGAAVGTIVVGSAHGKPCNQTSPTMTRVRMRRFTHGAAAHLRSDCGNGVCVGHGRARGRALRVHCLFLTLHVNGGRH